MRFLSNGDFIFPFQFYQYAAQHFYMWSYEHGAPNPNGIMRMPGRLIDIGVFALFGNLGGAYFYLFSCLAVAFLAFWWFARVFLGANRQSTALMGALFFTLNPIFLGNLSKVGLILAVAMLPLILTALQQGFQKKRFGYFMIAILALNVSLLHPFTLSVNLIVSVVYIVLSTRKHLAFLRDNAWKFGLLAIVALLLNAYFILPIASLGTLNKDSISDAVASSPTDYTSLVDIANTGDILTGMSLSKEVLKDYEFYGLMTWPFYFLGVLMFYVLLLGVYVGIEKQIKPHERRRFVIALGIFLVLVVLATASYLYADVLIKFMIGLPGGWAFRAPLKWQLYMPLVLFMALVIVLKNVKRVFRLRLLYLALGLCFLLMNGYLFKQIYERLLTPRSISHFSELERMPLDNKSLLFVDSVTCFNHAQSMPSLATELNQIFISRPVQVKHVQAGDIDTVNLGQYDFVIGCGGAQDEGLLTESYDFKYKASFAGGKYAFYENRQPLPYVNAVAHVFALKEPKEIGAKYMLAKNMAQPFNFILDSENGLPAIVMQDLFENLGPDNIINNRVHGLFTVSGAGQRLFIQNGPPVYFADKQDRFEFYAMQQEKNIQPAPSTMGLDGKAGVTYFDPTYSYSNIIKNPSLEEGLWQKKVGDCNAYDEKPSLSMRSNQQTKTDGLVSLEMAATSHVACTGPDSLQIEAEQHYLLSFDYRSSVEREAGYYVGFDDLMGSSTNARLPKTDGRWQTFNTKIVAPAGAKSLRLLVYAYPNKTLHTAGVAGYDNFKLIPIPRIIGRFFAVNEQQLKPTPSPSVEFAKLDPTKTNIAIKNADAPFYLITKESYHRLWRLGAAKYALPAPVRVNSTTNGWYIEPDKLCAKIACQRQTDGSYNIELTMEFTPQRWFRVGLLISGATAILVIIFIIYDLRQGKRQA